METSECLCVSAAHPNQSNRAREKITAHMPILGVSTQHRCVPEPQTLMFGVAEDWWKRDAVLLASERIPYDGHAAAVVDHDGEAMAAA